MNPKRILASTSLGLLFGLFCAYASDRSMPGAFGPTILAAIAYNRVLIGLVIGLADSIKIRPLLRGAILGAAVGLAIAIPSGPQGGAILLAASVAYGTIIDTAVSKYAS